MDHNTFRESYEFAFSKGKELRDKGTELSLNCKRVQKWKSKAETWLYIRPKSYRFTADELIYGVGLPDTGENQNNVVGATIASWAKKKRIKSTGDFRKSTRTARHAGILRVWEKL